MPDKDFEQQVRDGLQQWSIDPSDKVWTAVSARIRKRRRRWVLFWLFPAIGLLGAGGWWWYEGGTVPFRKDAAGHPPLAAAQTQVPAKPEPAGQVSAAKPQPRTSLAAGSAQAPAAKAPNRAGVAVIRGVGAAPPVRGMAAQGAEAVPPAAGMASRPAQAPSGTGATEPGSLPSEPPPVFSLTYTNGLPGLIPCIPCYPDPKLTFQPLAGEKSPHLPKKWEIRFYGGTGLSGQGKAFHFNTPAETVVYNSNPGYLSASTPTGGVVKDTLTARKNSAGFQIGVAWSRKLSRNWLLGAGMEYDFWKTAFEPLSPSVGTTNPGTITAITSNYSAVSTRTYVNHYQILQIPLRITWQMFPGRRLNPSVYSGVSLAYLFSGDALMYAPSGSGYVKNSSLLRHWSGNWETGLTFDIWHGGKYVLDAGPVFQYGLSGLQKGTPIRDHLNYGGIQLGFTLPGK